MEPNDDTPHAIPRRTTPTWEIELLISGALVFALLQAPALMDEWFLRREAQAGVELRNFLLFSQMYTTVVVYALIATFVLHISARAYWVALVGVHSVFPRGARWEEFSKGPATRALTEARTEPMPAAIERADNRASLVFGFGVLVVLLSVLVLVMTLVLLGIAMALNRLFVPAQHHDTTLFVLLSLLCGPLVVLGLIDSWICARLPPDHALTRAVKRGLRVLLPLFAPRWLGLLPLMPVLTTNLGRRRGTLLLLGALYGLLMIVMVEKFRGVDLLLADPAFPELQREDGMHPAHYATTRIDALRYSTLPFVQSEQIEDPWLRLFVPYVALRHAAPLRDGCPDVRPPALTAEKAERLRWIACFGRLLDVRIDGVALADPQFEIASDPATGQRGVIAMIDVRALAPGRHVLEIRRLPRVIDSTIYTPPAVQEPDDRIVFWR